MSRRTPGSNLRRESHDVVVIETECHGDRCTAGFRSHLWPLGHSRRSDGQQGFAACPLCLQ